ncbi:MAG TPA: HEPN domain-containing protein [Verrucomicrobiae bacterium]|jgi:hypothetical protein|nr:HEPN domain-containing protein [Verrucomicrobiae bacterium]
MNSIRTIDGQWWIYGDDDQPQFGTLTFDSEDGLELTVKAPRDCLRHATLDSDLDLDYRPQVIHGVDVHQNPITLFGSTSTTLSEQGNRETWKISGVAAALLNDRVPSLREAPFRAARFGYTLLDSWMDHRLDVNSKVEDGRLTLTCALQERFDYEISPQVRLKIDGRILRQESASAWRLEWKYDLWFIFAKDCDAETIVNSYGAAMLRLLSFLTDETVYYTGIALYKTDPFHPRTVSREYELLLPTPGISRAIILGRPRGMIAAFPEICSEVELVLKRWFACQEKMAPVLDLYSSVEMNRELTVETCFLFLAQALEVYHARSGHFKNKALPDDEYRTRKETILKGCPAAYVSWLREIMAFSNQPKLAQRIDEVLARHSDTAPRLTQGIKDFAAKVRYTRNYLTHYGESTERKAAKGDELHRIAAALKGLLKICLLSELGLKGAPVARVLDDWPQLPIPVEDANNDQGGILEDDDDLPA